MLDHAQHYVARGISVVPIPHRSKNPGIDGWQKLRLTMEQLPQYFNCRPQNVGVLLGEPSGWLIDIDLDHPRAVELADQLLLPPTLAVFGRPTKQRSHRLYRVSGPVKTKRIKSKKHGTIIELRSTGCQTVFPPSTHESGEPIRWDHGDVEPPLIDPEKLLIAVNAIGLRVLEELGERRSPKKPGPAHAPSVAKVNGPAGENANAQCLASMLRMKITDQKDGSHRLYCAACRAVEHDLTDAESVGCIHEYATRRPFPKGWSEQEILQRVRDAEADCTRGVSLHTSKRPSILLGTDEHRVIDEAVKALQSDKRLFQRGGILVRIVPNPQQQGVKRAKRSFVIQALPAANLRDRLTRLVELWKVNAKGDEVPAHPPSWLVAGLEARGAWPGIHNLVAVSDCPILRPDGTILQQPGYDLLSGVLYVPSRTFKPIPDGPTIDDARAALNELLEVVCDFRFERPEHRSAWLASLLTVLARYAFEGPSPIFLFDANVRGAGKTLLAQCNGRIARGQDVPVSTFTKQGEEMRKLITTIAIAGDPLILLDNLEGELGNAALDRALTSTRWKDRVLGGNLQIDVPLTTTWYASGNNVIVTGDTVRRVIHVRLDVLEEKPELRSDFRHPNLLQWISANREQLLRAALTILAGYCHAGLPDQQLESFGSFEGWSDIVRQAVVWVGLPDPCDTRLRLAEMADSVSDSIRVLFSAWDQYDPDRRGLIVADVINRLYPSQRDNTPHDEASVQMRIALEQLAGPNPEAKKIGNRLRTFRRKVVDHLYLDNDPSQRRRGSVWRLMSVQKGGGT